MIKSSEKSFFKGAIIGCVGALITGNGIALLLEAIQERIKEIIIMVSEQGHSALDAFLHTFSDVFGLILLAAGAYVIHEGAKKAGLVADYKKKKIISVKYCPKTKRLK